MTGIRFEVKYPASSDEIETLVGGLEEHTRAALGSPGFEPVAILARDSNGDLIGGVTGIINWAWLSVKLLWVKEDVRGRGLGRRLMTAIEDFGKRRGCRQAHVDTLGFQAPGFYERLGYQPFAELPDYTPGHARIYLRKRL